MVKLTAELVEIVPEAAVPKLGAIRAEKVGAFDDPASVQRPCEAIVSLIRVADDVVTLPPVIVMVKPETMVKFSVVPVVPLVAKNVPFRAAKEPVPAAEAIVKESPGRRP